MSSSQEIRADIQQLGIRPNGVLLVHASLRSLGKVDGGAEIIIQALLDVLGENGTLLMPALSYETVSSANPVFDVRHTSSCVGALTEYFRQRPGTMRSIHPTHSVCGFGTQAQPLLGDHDKDSTPCGPHSPFHKLPTYGGQILFLGCGLRPNTSMHAIEELIEPPYLYGDVLGYQIIHADGRVSATHIRRHNFKGWVQRYDRVSQILDEPMLRTGKVLAARCHLIEAAALWSRAHQKLQEDPLFFVDRDDNEHANS